MELKRCPFCGGEAHTEVNYIKCGGDELVMRATVFCQSCGCAKTVRFDGMNASFNIYEEQFKAAKDLWNRRTDNA